MPFPKPPISQRNTEGKQREIINAFLRLFFTGAAHMDDEGNPVTFPRVEVAFNQASIDSLTVPLIHWTFGGRKNSWQPGDGGMIVQTECLDSVLVQVNGKGRMDAADHECAEAASALVELLHSTQRVLLAQLGISRTRVVRGPTVLPMAGQRIRQLVVQAHLEYNVNPRPPMPAALLPAPPQPDLTPSAAVAAPLFVAYHFASLRVRILPAAGAEPFLAAYTLPRQCQTPGAFVYVNVEFPASANPTVHILDNGGPLKTVTSPDPAKTAFWLGVFYFNGEAWQVVSGEWQG